jgi:hypothetical protein
VPAEFIGMARAFRSRVLASNNQMEPLILRILKPLQQRLAKKPTIRFEMALDTVRRWRAMPAPFRMQPLHTDFNGSDGLVIHDWLLSASEQYDKEWERRPEDADIWEAGVSLVRLELNTAGKVRLLDDTPYCLFSLHSLGRWYERSGCWSDADLIADIAHTFDATEPEQINCDGAAWLGKKTIAHADNGRAFNVCNVRTFVVPYA